MLKLNDKKGLSAVVTTVLLIALTIAIVAIIWAVVSNLVNEQLGDTESCFGILEKVTLNPRYTCYNDTLSGSPELWFSISIADIEGVEDILVSISGEGTSARFKIKDDPAELLSYPSRNPSVSIPGENQGLSYIYQLPSSFTKAPDSVEIAPVIGQKQCGVSASIGQFDSCSSIA